jgi:glycerol-3-phosphate acyltransferase PlsX
MERPRVALLSNGEEPHKGSEAVKRAHQELLASHLNFIGNIEGRDILNSLAEVVVADGFVGNVVLKAMEGAVDVIFQTLKDEIGDSPRAKAGALLLKPVFRSVKEKMGYSRIGAAPLLGLNGLAFVGHGRSKAAAFANGIRHAKRAYDNQIVQAMRESLAQHMVERSGT